MPTTYPLTDESTGLTLPVTVSEGGPLTESEKQQIFSDYYAKNPRKPAYTQEQMNSQMEAVKTEPPQVGRVPMFNKSGNQVYQATASDLASQVVPINTQSAVKAYPKANTTGQRTAPDVSIPNYETTALPFLQMYESQINPGMNPYEKAAIPNTPAQQITRGFLGGLESFGTPTNAAILAGTSGASMALEALNAIKAARAVQLATTGLFAGQAGVSAINETRQAIENFQNNNPDEGYRNLGGAAVSGAMTGALGLGVKKGVKEFNSPIEKVNQPKTDTKAVTPPDDVSLAPYKQGDMVQVIGEASDTPLTVVRTILDGKMVLVKDSKGNAHKFLPSFLKPATVNQAGEQFVPPIVKKSGPTNETPTQEHGPINEVSGQDHGTINETSGQEHGPINEVSGTKYQGPRKPKATETPAQTELPLSGSVKDQLPPKTPTFKDDIEEGEHILATNTRLSPEDRQAVQGKIDEARKNQYLEKTPQGPINEVSGEPQAPTNVQSGELQDPTIPTANLPSPTENAATPPINAPKATPSTTLPPPPSPAAAAQKMPWEMTSLEYRRIKGYRGLEETAKGLREHRYAVLFAVMEGKPVPEYVLPEYKGLAWADAELAKRKEATVSAETASRLDATGAAAPYSRDALKTALNLTDPQAEATDAIVKTTGLDESKIQVAKGGTAAPGALEQGDQPAFYSRLTRTIEQSPQGKASGQQWKATIKGSKLGASEGEMDFVGVKDLEDGKTYTKQEVLDYLKANEVVVKDVTLGGETEGKAKARFERAMDWMRTTESKLGDWATKEAKQRGVDHSKHQYHNAWLGSKFTPEQKAALIEYGRARERAKIEESHWRAEATRTGAYFTQYQLPGTKEGSYREVLLTVPEVSNAAKFEPSKVDVKQTTRSVTQASTSIWYDGKRLADYVDDPRLQPDGSYKQRSKDYWIGIAKNLFEKGDERNSWRDGHYQYSDVANPIVRLRFNERTSSDGKRMLFLEEVQAPKKGQFEKMPALFQKNWREIAFKWAMRHAAENGFDSVGWTTGEQQAARYDLSKQVKGLSYRARTRNLKVQTPDGKSHHYDATPEMLAEVVGKDVAKKLVEQPVDEAGYQHLGGLDLKIGGEGLKKLYDSDFRNVVNNLPAVKKAGQKVGTQSIDTPTADATINSLTLTPALRESVMGRQALFQGKKGAVEFTQDGKAIIRGFANADVSTGVHEIAHIARRQLFDRNLKPEQRVGITDQDIAHAETWAGAKDGVWDRPAEEKFARGFERYLRDGEAPTEILRNVFAKFKEWLTNIYQRITGSEIDVKISPAMRQVFDQLVTRRNRIAKPTPAATTLPPVRIGGEPVRGERSQPYRLPLASKGSNENAENSRLILSSLVSVVKNEGGKYTDENINDAKYLLTKRTAYKEITKPQADLLAQLFNDHNLPYSARNVLNKFEKAITPEPVMSENEAINQGLSVRGVDKDTVKQPKPKLAESLGEHLDYNKELLLKNNSTVPEAYKVAVKDFLIKLQDLDKDSTGKELEPEALQVAQELVKNKVIPSSDLRAEAISLIKAAGKKSTLLKSTEGEPLLGGGSVAGNPSVTESPRVSSKIEKSPEEIRQGKITELVDRITENHPEFSDELSAAVENMNRGIKDEETNGLIDSLKDIIKDKEADKNVRKTAQSLMQELKELPDATEDVPETDPYLNPDHLDNVYDINPDDEGGFLRVGKGSGKKRFNNRGALDLSPVVQAYSKMVQRIEDFQKKRELTKRISSDRNVPESLAYRAAEPFHYVFNKETPDPLDRKALAWIRYAQAEEKPLTEYLERSKESKDATERGFPAEIQRAIELEGTTETTRKNFEVSSILQKEYQNDIESGLDYKEKLNYTPISVQYKGSNFEQLNFTQRRTNFSPLDLSEQVDKGKLTDIKSIETDLGNLTALRIYEGQRRIARNVLSAELQGMSHKGEYILRQPKLVDEQVEHSNPPKGYDTINIFGKSMYVQKGFKPLFSSLFNDGILTHNAYAKALDNYNSFAKTILFGVESFHDAQQHYMHLAGTREVPNLTGKLVPKIGRLLLDYTPEYARKQLSKGEIDQKTYDRFMEEYPKLAYAKNLKLGRTYEKTYMDYINSIPGGKKLFGLITPYTNYIFQTKGRAMSVELFIKNFDNNKKAYPSKTLEDLGRMSANETHIQMGMVGREGFLKSKDAQMVGRLLFLAARYRESKMLFEARAIGQTVKSITGLTKGQLHMGNLAKTALSLTALGFVINQMINYGFNGHSTFENSTEGDDSAMDKLAAKVNIKGGEVTIPVTTYAFPITSQIYRYMSRGDNILIAAGKLGLNGISYSGHILYNAYERIGDEFRPNRGEDIVKQLAIDIVPMPFLVKEFFLKGYPKTQIFGMSGIRARESSRYTAKEALYKGAKNDTRAITEWYGGRANKALEDTKKKIQTDGITDPKIKSQLYRESLIDVFDSIKNDNDFPTEVDKKIAVNKVQKIAISRMIGDTTMRVFLSKETLGEENK